MEATVTGGPTVTLPFRRTEDALPNIVRNVMDRWDRGWRDGAIGSDWLEERLHTAVSLAAATPAQAAALSPLYSDWIDAPTLGAEAQLSPKVAADLISVENLLCRVLQPGARLIYCFRRHAALTLWLNEPAAGRALDSLVESVVEARAEGRSSLEGWLLTQLSDRLSGRESPPVEASAALLGLSARHLERVLLDGFFRARWLNTLLRFPDNAGTSLDLFLEDLYEAVVSLTGRRDPVILTARARVCLQVGAWSVAESLIAEILATDTRPKTRAICLALQAAIEQRKNPQDAKAWMRAYQLLEESHAADRELTYLSTAALSSLWGAAKLAEKAGWHWQMARCLQQMRRTRLDRQKQAQEHTRARRDNIAAWFNGKAITDSRRLMLFSMFEKSAAELADLQCTYQHDPRQLNASRRTVALLATLFPQDDVVANLIRQMHPDRMEALAVALHRHGSEAISQTVCEAALFCLDKTPKAGVFAGNWLVRQYFDSDNFALVLRSTLGAMRARRYGERAIRDMRRFLPVAMSNEVATRCVAAVRQAARKRRTMRDLAGFFQNLMGDGLLDQIQPLGAGGYGALQLDQETLRAALWKDTLDATLSVDVVTPTSAVWIEARTQSRVLSLLEDALQPLVRPNPGSSGYTGRIRFVEARAVLSSNLQRPRLVVSYRIGRGTGQDKDWYDAIGTVEWQLAKRLLQLELDSGATHWHVSASPDRDGALIEFELALTSPQATRTDDSRLHGEFDHLFSVHLNCLTGREKAAITPALHEARSNAEELANLPPAEYFRARVATVNAAASKIRQTVRWRGDASRANLYELLSAVLGAFGAHAELSRSLDVEVTISAVQLRLVLGTILDNACKAISVKGGSIQVSGTVRFDVARVTVWAPHVKPSQYPAGCGVGIASVTAQIELCGGRLRQQRKGENWRVDVLLPCSAKVDSELAETA